MDDDMEYSAQELLPLVAELARQYTGGQSTSVTYEKAQQFMDGVLYCIREAGRADESGLAVRPAGAGEAYRQGLHLVAEKVKKMKDVYHGFIGDFRSYGNECLRDTVVKGIPEFLKWYDVKFAPQDTILTLDYPVLTDLSAWTGIDAVFEYVNAVSLEQRLLGNFPEDWIKDTLRAYCPDAKGMAENLCAIVLSALVRHVLLGKPLEAGAFPLEAEKEPAGKLKGCGKEELEATVRFVIRGLVQRVWGEDMRAADYFGKAAPDIAVRMLLTAEEKMC